jgi:hypothetical protein
MNIVQTFVLVGKHKLSKQLLYQMLFSCYSAVKLYGNCKLYTNKRTWEAIKNFDFPYTEVDTELLDGLHFTSNAFAIPKLHVFRAQTEPFIHIDFDTFLFKKLDIQQHNEIFYAYDDYSFLDFYDEDLKGHYKQIKYLDLQFYYKAYFESLFKLEPYFPDWLIRNLHIDMSPNFCIFGAYNTKLLQDVTTEQIGIYEDNKDVFDADENMSQIFEQLLFFPILSIIDQEFRYWQGEKFGFKGFFNRVKRLTKRYPFSIRNENTMVIIESHGKELMRFNSNLDEIRPQMGDLKISFYNKDGYRELLKADLGDFIHLGGHKGCQIMNRFLIDRYIMQNPNDFKLLTRIKKIETSSEIEFFERISLSEVYLYKYKNVKLL